MAKQWTQRARFIAQCSRNGTDVFAKTAATPARTGRGAAKQREGQHKSKETALNKGGQSRTRVYGEAVP